MGGEGTMANTTITLRNCRNMIRSSVYNKKNKSTLNSDKLNNNVYEKQLYDNLEPMDKKDIHGFRLELTLLIAKLSVFVIIALTILYFII